MVNDTKAVVASKMLKWHTEGLLYVERLVIKARYNVQEGASDVMFAEDGLDCGSRCVYPVERVALRQTSAVISSSSHGGAGGLHDSCDVIRRCGI
jgi:hypothetical protein